MPDDGAKDILDRRIFWRIIFDVFDHEVRLQEIVTCWQLVQETTDENGNLIPPFQYVERGFRKVINLQYQIIGDVSIKNDRAVFNGGYLECKSADLTAYANECDLTVLENPTRPVNGENVSILADVKLNASNVGEPNPIFYYPQTNQPEAATLVERVDPLKNFVTVDWAISGLPIMSDLHFRLEQIDGWHRVRVQQDVSGATGNNIFEMWVDSAWLGDHVIVNPDHNFDSGPQTFYIGWDAVTGHHGLFGELSRLEFDPNTTCTACKAFEPNPHG